MPDMDPAKKKAIEDGMPKIISYKGFDYTKVEYKGTDIPPGGKMPKAFYENKDADPAKILLKAANPEKISEIVAEALTGQVINQIAELYAPEQKESVVCAEVFKYGDGDSGDQFGIIQPSVDFIEFFELMGTGQTKKITDEHGKTRYERDRNEYTEEFYNFFGSAESNPHMGLAELLENQKGLSFGQVMSKLTGDDSVHSANFAVKVSKREKERFHKLRKAREANGEKFSMTELKDFLHSVRDNNNGVLQIVRLDFGGALRHLASSDNLSIVQSAHHSRYTFKSIRASFQHYFGKYQYFKSLPDDMMQDAAALHTKLSEHALYEIILEATNTIIERMDLNDEQRAQVATDLDMPFFLKVAKGAREDNEQFAKEFSKILYSRLTQLSSISLKEESEKAKDQKEVYQHQSVQRFKYTRDHAQLVTPKNEVLTKCLQGFTEETFKAETHSPLVEATRSIIETSLGSTYEFKPGSAEIYQGHFNKDLVKINVLNPVFIHNKEKLEVEGSATLTFHCPKGQPHQLVSIQTDNTSMASLFFGNKNLEIPAIKIRNLTKKMDNLVEKRYDSVSKQHAPQYTLFQIFLLKKLEEKSLREKSCDASQFIAILKKYDTTGKLALANAFISPPSGPANVDIHFIRTMRAHYNKTCGKEHVDAFVKEALGTPQSTPAAESAKQQVEEKHAKTPLKKPKDPSYSAASSLASSSIRSEAARRKAAVARKEKNDSTPETPETPETPKSPKKKQGR